jgi:hypothetical protein
VLFGYNGDAIKTSTAWAASDDAMLVCGTATATA